MKKPKRKTRGVNIVFVLKEMSRESHFCGCEDESLPQVIEELETPGQADRNNLGQNLLRISRLRSLILWFL